MAGTAIQEYRPAMPVKPPPANIFSFDMIDAAGYGYHRVWTERHYLLKLSLIPILMKFVAAIAYYVMGFEDDILRRGLFMLPALFAEGWVLAQFLRTLLMEERWPQTLPKERDDVAIARLILRARGIISATLIFVMIQLVSTVVAWGVFQIDHKAQALAEQRAAGAVADATGADGLMIIPVLGLLVASIWSFRLLWLNIPYAVLMPIRVYLSRLGGFMASVRMLGLFLVCVIPLSVFATLLAQMLVSGTPADTDPPALAQFVIMFISAATDMMTALIATTGMAYALRNVVPHHPDALKDVHDKKSS